MPGYERTEIEIDGGTDPVLPSARGGASDRVSRSAFVAGMILLEAAWIGGLAYVVFRFVA